MGEHIGLPRVRGDRPLSEAEIPPYNAAPPRTRGSTRPAVGGVVPCVGSPAYAGIDPPADRTADRRRRLPRVRGDRPRCVRLVGLVRWAPPRTRGSTRRGRRSMRPSEGSPAYAGIDPPPTSSAKVSVRLPRVRGDRPEDWETTIAVDRAPPRTRGSTSDTAHRPLSTRGSPAYAGIDPRIATYERSRTRLPRVRGDRPISPRSRETSVLAPPRTRGSTCQTGRNHFTTLGSPAYAGIDPPAPPWRTAPSGLPRVRGDRPKSSSRARCRPPAPPRTRGSTLTRPPRRHRRPGSPAYAGIDPRMKPVLPPAWRLPRVRGDRPAVPGAHSRLASAPPRTRGSTLAYRL